MAEAFNIVLAWLNPATADPIRRCLRSPFASQQYKINGEKNLNLSKL